MEKNSFRFMCGALFAGHRAVGHPDPEPGNIPRYVRRYFRGAFTGTAAASGFSRVPAVATAIRQGVSRSVYSNGNGRNLSADPRLRQHGPSVRQGLWGSSVFCDTADRMHLLRAGGFDPNTWTSGARPWVFLAFPPHAAALGEIFLGIMTLLFAFHDLNDLVSLLPEHSQLSVGNGRPS